MDVVAKVLYARALCTSHSSIISPEDFLAALLLQEEQSNASIRQVFIELNFYKC
jgi:hypothetical protein